jgi:predicted phage tail protein
MKCILSILFFISISYSDDIYFRNGTVCKNVLIIDTIGNKINVQLTGSQRTFPLTTIRTIIKKEYNPSQQSIVQENYKDEELETEITLFEAREQIRLDSLERATRISDSLNAVAAMQRKRLEEIEKSKKDSLERIQKSKKDSFDKIQKMEKDSLEALAEIEKERFEKAEKMRNYSLETLAAIEKERLEKIEETRKDSLEVFMSAEKERLEKIEELRKDSLEAQAIIKEKTIEESKKRTIKNILLTQEKDRIKLGIIKETRYPYLKLLPLGILALGLSYDSFCDAVDASDSINDLKKINGNANISQLRSRQSRKTILGVVYAVAGLFTCGVAFEPEIVLTVEDNSIVINYRF